MGHDWFHTAILSQRDQVASHTSTSTADVADAKCGGKNKGSDGASWKPQGIGVDATEEMEGKLQEMVVITSSDQCPENMRPDNIGTSPNLPVEIRSMVYWGSSSLLAWSTLDPDWEPTLFRRKCCYLMVLGAYGMFLFSITYRVLVGCILLFAILLFFFHLIEWNQQGLRNTYWLLTNRDLIIVTQRFGFFPDRIRYISLDHIERCGIAGRRPASLLFIDTRYPTNNDAQQHYVEAYGLAGSDWFQTAILRQRDQFRVSVRMQDRNFV